MLDRRKYPILEFDTERQAVIEPAKLIKSMDVPEHCVLCFFAEAIAKIVREKKPRVLFHFKSESHKIAAYEMPFEGRRLMFLHAGVGAPLAAAILEEVIARGGKKFIVCGGAGVLDRDLKPQHIVVPTAAVRDEGTSYHYLPPGREVKASSPAVTAIEKVLKRHNLGYSKGKTWTTDAFYRETRGKVALRKKEGCLTVEMEAAAFFAVSRFRKTVLGQILYCGDDVSGEEWDSRNAWDRMPVRERLFYLSAEAALAIK